MIKGLLRALGATLLGREPAAPVRFPRPWLSALGVLILMGLGTLALQYMQNERGLAPYLAALTALGSVLPLYLMYRSPLWAWRVVMVAMAFGGFGHKPDEPPWNPVQIIVALVVLFVVALRERTNITFWVAVLTLGLVISRMRPEYLPVTIFLLTVAMILGHEIQRRRRVEKDLEVQSERGQLADARTRIARELHDVVAHSMSLVAVRAETAPYRLTNLPEEAKNEFIALASTARESLTEMRRLLGVLRTEGDTPELAPQPTLSDVDELVASARRAGMTVHTDISVTSADDALGLSAYRIVQEALSNAARHAPGVPVEIKVKEHDGAMVIEVRNGPGGEVFADDPGHGMTGMRERAELLGGTFEAGPRSDGGFGVTATIPSGGGDK
jgi:signal transduction histidine kinase